MNSVASAKEAEGQGEQAASADLMSEKR